MSKVKNMKEGLIGVIVPVYKVEKYIAECIESILAQTYTNFRLILVDDGTPDNAGKICDEYAKKDPRITVIHQENAGVTRARERGVEEADDCEFITFVDGDDTIQINAFKLLFSEIVQNDVDIIISDYEPTKTIKANLISTEAYRKFLLAESNVPLAPWGKLFKKELFDSYTFDIPRSITIAEDIIMNIRLAFNTTKNIRFLKKEIYNYRVYQESSFHSHIRTPEDEQAIHKNKVASIPPTFSRDKYIISTIPVRLLRFREFWGYKYAVEDMKRSEFYTNLHSDIKKYKISIPFIDWVIFNNSNCIIRFFAINTKKIINKIYRQF